MISGVLFARAGPRQRGSYDAHGLMSDSFPEATLARPSNPLD